MKLDNLLAEMSDGRLPWSPCAPLERTLTRVVVGLAALAAGAASASTRVRGPSTSGTRRARLGRSIRGLILRPSSAAMLVRIQRVGAYRKRV